MSEPIRVRDNTTLAEYSTYGTAIPGLTKLDEPAVDVRGDLLPAKYPTAPAAPQVPEPTTGRTATTKES
jgi:hypothetical protein